MKKKVTTLCIIHQHPRVLLGMKKRGFGEGRFNGFGGKVNLEETIEQATKRELHEEAGIEVKDIEQVGIIEFEFSNGSDSIEMHIYRADDFSGEPVETEEMKPQWFKVANILYAQMWPDDIHWMPLFLAGKKFKGKFLFEGHNTILNKELIEVVEV